ncbi:hypothetical protein V7O66_04075 [Methanolobus sp. ZRKC3]
MEDPLEFLRNIKSVASRDGLVQNVEALFVYIADVAIVVVKKE